MIDETNPDLKFTHRISFKGHTIYGYPVYWYLDNYKTWNCFVPTNHPYNNRVMIVVHTWISQRPHYCDRGKYLATCDYVGLDAQDGLPKYGMHLHNLMYEMTCWLQWRFEQRYVSIDPIFNPPSVKLEDLALVEGGCETDPKVVIETLKEIYRQHTATSSL